MKNENLNHSLTVQLFEYYNELYWKEHETAFSVYKWIQERLRP